MRAKARFLVIFSRSSSSWNPSGRALRARLALLAAAAAALLLIPAAPALAGTATITLEGSGAGTVTSDNGEPEPIDCSISGGVVTGNCFIETPNDFVLTPTSMTATAAPGSVFTGWTVGAEECFGSTTPCKLYALHFFEEYSLTATFIPAPDPPIVTTGGSGPGANKYLTVIEGAVNPGGVEVEDCQFEYGPTTKYGTSAPCVPGAAELGEGTEDKEVSAEAELEELKGNTTYHYRVVASNLGGAREGADREFTTGPPPSEDELPPSDHGCENAEIRSTQVFGTLLLPECMALEMVSPPQKAGQPAEIPAVSVDGERVKFQSLAALDETPAVIGVGGTSYVASRGSSGWTTAPTAPPGGQFVTGWNPAGAALSFTPDFSSWFQILATLPQRTAGIDRAYRGGLGGFFSPISPLLVPQFIHDPRAVVEQSEFQGASADHSHLYFKPGQTGVGADRKKIAYLPGDPEPGPEDSGAELNTYVAQLDSAGEPSLELLARDRQGKLWGGNCGAHLGGAEGDSFSETAINGNRNQGAISPDGSRVYFSARAGQPAGGDCNVANKLRILERLETSQGIHIEELITPECSRVSPPCDPADGNDRYQGASVDGAKVYFTTNRQLTNSDLDGGAECRIEEANLGCDLYLYDSTLPLGQRLVQVSAGGAGDPTPGEGAKVYNGIAAISGDGSHVYFAAQGVLTTDANPQGKKANEYSASTPKLYLYERDEAHPNGRTAFVGALSPGDSFELWGTRGGTFRNRAYPVPVRGRDIDGSEIGGNGHVLLFQSAAPLIADDTDGTRRDFFRYDANSNPPTLERISKAAPGGEDNAPFEAVTYGRSSTKVLGTDFAEQERWASEDGEAVVFKTAEGLVPGDVNGLMDSYLWKGGEVFRLPGTAETGQLSGESTLSPNGSEVAFQSFSQLLPQDGDLNLDVYVARAGGGFPLPEAEEPCQPDESLPGRPCQEGKKPPVAPNPASTGIGAGNPKPTPRSCPKGKRKVRKKGNVRCVRSRHNREHRKPHRTRDANTNRRAAK